MMTKDAELLEGIFTGGWSNILKSHLTSGKSIPLKLIKLGLSHAKAEFQHNRVRKYDASLPANPSWIHALADCEEVGAEELIEELFLADPRNKGPCLLALSEKNPEKAFEWLDTIHKFDPNFQILDTPVTPFFDRMRRKYPVKDNAMFNMIYMNSMKQDKGKIDQIIEPLLLTRFLLEEKNEGKLQKPDLEKINKINQERMKVIKSQTLNPEQADKLFELICESNIDFKEYPKENILERNFRFVFVSFYDGDHWYLKYDQEVNQLIELTSQVSGNKQTEIEMLFDNLPFWDTKYKLLADKIATSNPNKYTESWKNIIQAENERFSTTKGWSVMAPRPDINTILIALSELSQMKLEGFNEYLISLINHHSEEVRAAIQKLLSGESFDIELKSKKRGRHLK